MKVIRPLSLTILVLITVYLLADECGIVEDFTGIQYEEVNDHHGIGYRAANNKSELVYIFHVSFMKDPETKEFNIYKGAMKKSALDRMTHIEDATLTVKESDTTGVQMVLAAKKLGANVVLINSSLSQFKLSRKEK